MKRLLLIMLMIATPICADAGSNPYVLGSGVEAAGEDCTCTGSGVWENGDVERFEYGANDWCTIVVSGVDWNRAGTNPDVYNSEQPKTCSYSMKASAATGGSSVLSGNITDVTGGNSYTTSFWFRIGSSLSGWNNNTIIGFFAAQGPNTRFRIKDVSGTKYFNFDGGSAEGNLSTSPATDTWYKVKIVSTINGNSTLTLYNSSGSELESITKATPNTTATVLSFGVQYNNTNVTGTVYIDDLVFGS